VKSGTALGTRASFSDVGATVAEWLGLEAAAPGRSFARELVGAGA
jgi:phosphopentomutase